MAKKEQFTYTEAAIKRNRTFPTKNVIIITVLALIQAALIIFACLYRPTPQDEINIYTVTVEPLSDGSLDIEYSLIWTPLDEEEPLSWIEIGVANPNYTLYPDSYTGAIKLMEKHHDGDYVSVIARLNKEYKAGESLALSFKINQRGMLTTHYGEYFYEFVPCWFNAIPVRSYTLKWKAAEGITSSNLPLTENGYLVSRGSLDAGQYVMAQVCYSESAFSSVNTVSYEPFDDYGVENELKGEKIAVTVFCVLAALVILAVQIYLADSFVSYHRGRGFLRGYGYHIHTYGRVNPHYRREAEKHGASASGRGGGGGCACACACACAGGGRAGCSRKDTTLIKPEAAKDETPRA